MFYLFQVSIKYGTLFYIKLILDNISLVILLASSTSFLSIEHSGSIFMFLCNSLSGSRSFQKRSFAALEYLLTSASFNALCLIFNAHDTINNGQSGADDTR